VRGLAARQVSKHKICDPYQQCKKTLAALRILPFGSQRFFCEKRPSSVPVDIGTRFAPAEDYDLWLRVTEHFQCSNLEDVVLKYRIHPQQVSLRKRKQQTLGILAAQRSAAMRQEGEKDIFSSVDVVTPDVLKKLV
jgi:hypothetical protein